MTVCKYCDKIFTPRTHTQRYCTTTCKRHAAEDRLNREVGFEVIERENNGWEYNYLCRGFHRRNHKPEE